MPAAPSILGSTGSTTVVLVVLLVALGLAMLGATAWLVRSTRTDTRALGPLEVMGDRRFSRGDAEARAAVLAGARPEGAVGPAPMIEIDGEDEEPAEAGPVVAVDDVEPEPAEATPVVAVDGVEPEPEPEPEPDPEPEPEPEPEPGDPVDVDEPAEAAQRAN